MNDDYLFIPQLGLIVKIHRDKRGEYVHLPGHGSKKFYIKPKEASSFASEKKS